MIAWETTVSHVDAAARQSYRDDPQRALGTNWTLPTVAAFSHRFGV